MQAATESCKTDLEDDLDEFVSIKKSVKQLQDLLEHSAHHEDMKINRNLMLIGNVCKNMHELHSDSCEPSNTL
jgi:hypothetical protein